MYPANTNLVLELQVTIYHPPNEGAYFAPSLIVVSSNYHSGVMPSSKNLEIYSTDFGNHSLNWAEFSTSSDTGKIGRTMRSSCQQPTPQPKTNYCVFTYFKGDVHDVHGPSTCE